LSFIMNANTPSPVTPSLIIRWVIHRWWLAKMVWHVWPHGPPFRAGSQVSWPPLYRYIIVIHTLLCNSPSKYNYIFLFYRYEINKEVTKEQN
jgi:hypothetical protein